MQSLSVVKLCRQLFKSVVNTYSENKLGCLSQAAILFKFVNEWATGLTPQKTSL